MFQATWAEDDAWPASNTCFYIPFTSINIIIFTLIRRTSPPAPTYYQLNLPHFDLNCKGHPLNTKRFSWIIWTYEQHYGRNWRPLKVKWMPVSPIMLCILSMSESYTISQSSPLRQLLKYDTQQKISRKSAFGFLAVPRSTPKIEEGVEPKKNIDFWA